MNDYQQTLTLLLFNRQFQAMINSGMNLLSCTELLARIAPTPYREFAPEIKEKMLQGHYLSAIFSTRPDLFSRYYAVMIRVGEHGGVLDEILGNLTDMLVEELKFTRALQQPPSFPTSELTEPLSEQWTMLRFSRSLSTMHMLGVPMTLALEVASETLPTELQQPVKDLLRVEPREEAVTRLISSGLLSPLLTQLLHMGHDYGDIGQTMRQCADLYHDQLSYLLGIDIQHPAPVARIITEEMLPEFVPEDDTALLEAEIAAIADLLRQTGSTVPIPMTDGEDFLADPCRQLWFTLTQFALFQEASELLINLTDGSCKILLDGQIIREMSATLFPLLAEFARQQPADYAFGTHRGSYLLHVQVDSQQIHLTITQATSLALQEIGKVLKEMGIPLPETLPDSEQAPALLDALLTWLRCSDIEALRLMLVNENERTDCIISTQQQNTWKEGIRIPAGMHLIKDLLPELRQRAGITQHDRRVMLTGTIQEHPNEPPIRVEIQPVTISIEREGTMPYIFKAKTVVLMKESG